MADFGFDVQEEGDFGQNIASLKEIALIHIRKISGICCNELIKGYWEEKPVKVGGGIAIMRRYNPDGRATFCNAVDFLLWIVAPLADTDFKTKYLSKELNFFTDENNKVDWDKRLKHRQEIFRDINVMFNRCNFFDSHSGQSE